MAVNSIWVSEYIQRHTLMAFQTSHDGSYFLKELKLSHCITVFCALSAHSSENKESLWGERASMDHDTFV